MTPAETLAAARSNVVGPYVPATDALLSGWCGPVLAYDGVPGVVTGPDHRPESERHGLWNVAASDAYGWEYGDTRSCRADELRLDLHRPEVRDFLVRRGALVWARDIPVALWVWGMGVEPEVIFPGWAEVDHVAEPWERALGLPGFIVGVYRYGWEVRVGGKFVARGPETGPEGMACADLAALRAGCILEEPDGWLVPMPDGGIGFWPRS